MTAHLPRIRQLAIPPAWTNVWISPDPRAHLQATGRDARGRLQYRYHPDWNAACAREKFRRVAALGRQLPRIRRRLRKDLARPGITRERVLAAIVLLLEASLIRVGNAEYARDNGSFGLTTLRKRHIVRCSPRGVRFRFVGKGTILHDIQLRTPAVAAVIRECRALPGRELFQYRDPDGAVHDIGARDVNAYLASISDPRVTAKDFRTWSATVLMHRALQRMSPGASARERSRQLKSALEEVAGHLGNTVAVCRKSYVHPILPELWLAGRLPPVTGSVPVPGRRNLNALERATLRLLEKGS